MLASCILLFRSAQYWYHVKKVGVISAHFIKACIRLAVHQVLFSIYRCVITIWRTSRRKFETSIQPLKKMTSLILILDIGVIFNIYRKEDVLCQLKIRGASEKFKNKPRHLLRQRSVNFRQHFRNLSRKTVPLMPKFAPNLICFRRNSFPVLSRKSVEMSSLGEFNPYYHGTFQHEIL
jgi:hypothetical protein